MGVSSFGILVPTFFVPLELGSPEHLLLMMAATIITFVIWEGSKFIQALIMYRYPWEKSFSQHLAYEIVSIFIFSSLILTTGILTYNRFVSSVNFTVAVVLQNIIVSFLLALLFTAINEGAFLFSKWKESLLEQERLRQENLVARVESLKKQLDPHFLFNSLSVLSGVVYKDPVLADRFITKLAQVYRYVIDHNDSTQVPLQQEITFVEAYCFLLNVRFYNKVILDVDITRDPVYVLPMSLQLLVENAVKHNRISENHPLELRIYTQNDMVWVENRLNRKETRVDSTGIGLKNLEARYKYILGKPIRMEQTNAIFKVGLPLISEKAGNE
jgi:sensor histidine kinase YesM